MNAKSYSTRTALANGRYPSLQVFWDRDEDEHGYEGTAQVWADGDTKLGPVHTISVRQCMPLGGLYMTLDGFAGGCWSATHIEIVEMTERDLMWAAAWAGENFKENRQHWMEHEHRSRRADRAWTEADDDDSGQGLDGS